MNGEPETPQPSSMRFWHCAREDEAAAFFRDLCTLRELTDLSHRWAVVRLLDQGRPYRQIAEETSASTATITRINQWLQHGAGGYRLVLDRLGGGGRDEPAEMIRLAMPNKGRLQQPTVDLMRTAGLAFETTDRALSVTARNADVELLFVRTEDVPELVNDGVADLGITGQDLLAEFGTGLEVLAELAYGHCRLAAAVPTGSAAAKVEDLAGLRVATAHPHATSRFFDGRSIEVTVVPLRGSVEVATKLGVADAIVDLVSTGSTLTVNGLREVGVVLASQAVLVAGSNGGSEGPGNGAAGRVATAIKAVVAGRRKRYLLLNAPSHAVGTISNLIPGLEAPTVVPLAEQGMVAIHSVVGADDIWNLLPLLEEAGGTGILVLPIEQLVP